MRTLKALALGMALLGAAVWAQAQTIGAYPNLNATTGILAVPTASMVGDGAFVGAADILFQNDTLINARAVYGVSDQFELGAGIIAGNDTAIGVTGKIGLAGLDIGGFSWAGGASLISGSDSLTGDGWQIFFTGTKPFGSGGVEGATLLGTVGIGFTDIDQASALRPFVGAQLRLSPRTEIDGEFVFETGDFDESILSLFIRHQMTDDFSVQAGITNATGFTGSEDHDLFVGGSWAFGQ